MVRDRERFCAFFHSPLCRSVARFLIFTLLAMDLPPNVASAASPMIRYVDNANATCHGHIPCYSTIQAAIADAKPGETVRVQAGEYAESLILKGKNQDATEEIDRIIIEADPDAPVGSVVLRGVKKQCTQGSAILIQQSQFITIRGLTVTNAGGQAIELLGGNNSNRAIHLERNRLSGNGGPACDGGITIQRENPDLVISNNLIYHNGCNGISFGDAAGGPHYLINNTIYANSWNGVRVT